MLELFSRPEVSVALLSALQDGVVILDPRGVHAFVNDAFCRMTGFDRDSLLGLSPPFPYWPHEELPEITRAFDQTLGGVVASFELVFMTREGKRFPVIVSPAALRCGDGGILGYVATVKDITERKKLEQALVASEQRWRSIAETPFDFVVTCDRQYRYTYVNHTAPGLTREDLIGKKTSFDFTAPEYHDAMRKAYETTFETGRPTSYDVYSPFLDAWYSSVVGPIWENGKVTSVSVMTRDITAQKRAEEALRRSEHQLREAHKMETIGTLAGGIAHDLNNILTPILAYSDLAQLAIDSNHALQPHLAAIHEAALRARDLVLRILLFSRRQEPQKRVLDLGDRLRESAKLLKATLPATIEIRLELPEEPVWVFADRTQLDQLVANLATNALQAMKETGGLLTISLGHDALPATAGDLAPGGGPGTYAALRVTDTGPGMDADTQRRAFDPFFTTKAPGSGTGLGLSIVHGIAREHGGDVSVTSAEGQGATFTVHFPLVSPEVLNNDSKIPLTLEPCQRPLRVMCLDDEPSVAHVAREALALRGHTAYAITNGIEALERFKADPQAIDVLVTDQTMPQIKGTALILACRAIRPDLPCVLMTGLGDDDTLQGVPMLGIGEVLQKPFSPGALVTATERAAADPSSVRLATQ